MGTFSNTGSIIAQSSDPGATGAGAIWSDTDAKTTYRRDDCNSGWDVIFPYSPGSAVVSHSSSICDYSTPSSASATSTHATKVMDLIDSTVDATHELRTDNCTNLAGEKAETACSSMIGNTVKRFESYLEREGSPGGTAYARVYDSCDTLQATIGSKTANCIATGGEKVIFTDLSQTYSLTENDRVVIEFACSTSGLCNNIKVGRDTCNGFDGTNSVWTFGVTGAWDDTTTTNDQIMAINDFCAPNAINCNTSKSWISNCEANPTLTVDMGAATFIAGVAVHLDRTNTTETEFQIQVGDGSTWETMRTVTVSDLTDDTWEFRRINIRHQDQVRIRGSSGSSVRLAINEVKVYTRTSDQILDDLGLVVISSTDTTLADDGT